MKANKTVYLSEVNFFLNIVLTKRQMYRRWVIDVFTYLIFFVHRIFVCDYQIHTPQIFKTLPYRNILNAAQTAIYQYCQLIKGCWLVCVICIAFA